MTKKNGLLGNLSWKFAERITAQLVTLVVSVILARLLDPAHYGTISIVMIFISIANVFVSDGFGSALIQKKDPDVLDYSSVLYFNILFSIILYFVLYFSAPVISSFYGNGYEELTPVLRVLGLRLILSAINSVQQAYVAKNMIFRKFFWSTLFGTLVSAIVGIIMAYKGCGVWALVAQYLTNSTVDTLVLFLSLRKLPVLRFSITRLRNMLKFGSQILASSLLITGYQELRAIIIGKVYSASDLAYYDKGRQFPNVIVTNINVSISAVLFPKMANEQTNLALVKETTRNSIRFSAYLMSPIMIGLAGVAKSFVSVILTDKWLPCVPIMQLFCIIYLFHPIHTANIQAIKAIGRSDIHLKLEIIKKTIELISLILVMRISVNAIVISMAVLTTLFTLLNAYPNRKLLNYSFKEQMMDMLPPIGMSILMFIIIIFIGLIPFSTTLIKLIIQIVVGACVYIFLSMITKNVQFMYLFSMIKNFKKTVR